MKEDKTERIIKKYKEGNSTLEEEQFLFENSKSSEHELKAWSTFIQNNKVETPENFNEALWESFENKKDRKRKIFVSIMTAAASVIILLSLYMTNFKQKELNYTEKEALLNQALNMVSNSGPTEAQRSIIYENDMVIIYTSTE